MWLIIIAILGSRDITTETVWYEDPIVCEIAAKQVEEFKDSKFYMRGFCIGRGVD